ncbi:MAG: PrsW family intramembrane metalloprotease [Candidatus Binatia bacterium]
MARRMILIAWIGGLTLGLAHGVAAVPAAICAAAAVPALAWTTLVCLLVRREREPMAVVTATLLAGAVVAAWPASNINQTLLDWLTTVTSESSARWTVPAVVAPMVEELAKAVALGMLLILVPGRTSTIVRGMVSGALVGIGFAMTENIQCLTLAAIQGGTTGLWHAAYLRGLLGGLQHATFTAATGVGLAYGRQALTAVRRWLAVGLGLVAATVQHMVWNAAVAGTITELLCGAEQPAGPCRSSPDVIALFVTTPLLAMVTVAPGIATLFVISARARQRESVLH